VPQAAVHQGPRAHIKIPPEIIRLLKDPVAFGEAIGYKGDPKTGRKRFDVMHREMLAHCAFGTRKAIAEPRGHAKSTCISVILSAWKLARDPDRRIMNASATMDLSTQLVGEVRDRLNGDLEIRPGLYVPVRTVFPHLALAPVDRRGKGPTEKLNILGRTPYGGREPSIFASGVDTNNAGKHPTDLHFDDLQNEKNSKTWSQRQKVIQFVRQAVPIARYFDSPICAVMTSWAPDDLLQWMLDHPAWDVILRGVYDGVNPETGIADGQGPCPEGTWPLCPNFMNAREIAEARDEVGEVFFAAQYLNKPIPAEDALFDKGMLDAFQDLDELAPKGSKLQVPPPGTKSGVPGQILLWDPVHRLEGQATQKRSMNGLLRVYPVPARYLGINWMDPNRNVFLATGAWEIPGGTDDACCFVESLVQRDPTIRSIWIEQNAAQETLKPWLEERGRIGGVNIRLQRISGSRGTGRLQGLVTAIRKGYFRILPDAEGKDLLLRRMSEFPLSDSDDVLNAAALLSTHRERRGVIPGLKIPDTTPLSQRLFHQ